MSIRVTCPGCHARFNVHERFAGKEGPCPKCKVSIKIPKDEVIIHAPVDDLPTDSQGRSIIAPIPRKETRLDQIQIVLISCCVVGFFAAALVLRIMVDDKADFPQLILWIAAVVLAIPIVLGAYSFLRDQELGVFTGGDLWARIGITSACYAALWLAMPVAYMAFNDSYELGSWSVALVAMLAAGGAIAMLVLDLDYIMGLAHYGCYVGVCLLGRMIIGIGVLPGMLESEATDSGTAAIVYGLEWIAKVQPGLLL